MKCRPPLAFRIKAWAEAKETVNCVNTTIEQDRSWIFLRYSETLHCGLSTTWKAHLKYWNFKYFWNYSPIYSLDTTTGCSLRSTDMHSLFVRRNFVKPISGRGMNSLVVYVIGLLFHRASPTNGDQICSVQEARKTASQPGIIPCHCASANSPPGDKTIRWAMGRFAGAGLAIRAVCHLTYMDVYLTEPKSGKANRNFFSDVTGLPTEGSGTFWVLTWSQAIVCHLMQSRYVTP
jgi:hypothetical protein